MTFSIRTILVPVDFGEASEHALGVALDLAQAVAGKVHVLHVYQLPMYGFPDGAFLAAPDVAARLSDSAQNGLNQLVERISSRGVPVSSSLRQGTTHEEIVAAALEVAADVIVIGTHGRGPLAHALLGSVTERVVRTSPTPVMTVRHRSHAHEKS